MSKASTWADGFGRWHAVVADTPRGLINAVEALTDEIAQRENTPRDDVRNYVHANIVSTPENVEPGFVHFMEYALED